MVRSVASVIVLTLSIIILASFLIPALTFGGPPPCFGTANSQYSSNFLSSLTQAVADQRYSERFAGIDSERDDSARSWSGSVTEWFNSGADSLDKWDDLAYANGSSVRLLVGIKSGKHPGFSELEEIATRYGAKLVDSVTMRGETHAIVVELEYSAVPPFAEEASSAELVDYVEPDVKVRASFEPNDPEWALQWAPKIIQADWAWNTTLGRSDLLVAVIDSGIDYSHPDLSPNYVPLGYDWVNEDAFPLDDYGHGTHCAGIIAAVTNNSIGVAGTAQVKVMAEKVLDANGFGYFEWIAKGIVNATDCGAKILSLSFSSWMGSGLLYDAVRYAYEAGVLIIASAGNSGSDSREYPAGYSEVIAVAATNESDEKASSSNWGDWIELSAPGVQVYSTMPTYNVTLNEPGYADRPFFRDYDFMNGTSMACPFVAGTAALVWSRFPNMTRDRVRLQLRYTADDLGDTGFDEYYGYGRVNARRAVEQTPAEHDLLVTDWKRPRYVKPGNSAEVNSTIFNFGENDEEAIEVRLLANGTLAGSTTIEYLASYASATASCSWTPTLEGTYNITSYVVPATGETVTDNNFLSAYTVVSAVISVPEIFPTILDAVDAANPGDSVFISEGTYTGGQIDVDKPLKLIANGTVTLEGNEGNDVLYVTADNVTAEGFTIMNYSGIGINVAGGRNVTIRNTTIDGSLRGYGGIRLYQSSNSCLLGNNVVNNSWYGIVLYESSFSMLQYNLMSDNEWDFGVIGEILPHFSNDIDGSNTVDGKPVYYWMNREATEVPEDAGYVALVNCTDIVVRNLNLTKNWQGILMAGTADSNVTQNSMSECDQGIYLWQSSNNTVAENRVVAESAGVRLYQSSNNKIFWNNVTFPHGGGDGISIYESSDVTVFRNNVTNAGGYGVAVIRSSSNTIMENALTNSDDCGIELMGSSNNTIRANEIRNSGDWMGAGIELTYCSIWEGCWPSGYSDNNTIIGNNVTGNLNGIVLSGSEHNLLVDNDVTDNRDVGIRLETAAFNILRNNRMAGNKYNLGVLPDWDEVWPSTYTQDIDTSNTVNGKPVYYLVNQEGLTLNSPDIGYLGLVNCTNIRVKNATLSNNDQGLLLAYTVNSTIEDTTITGNRVGIQITVSNANTIATNAVANNSFGISLYMSSSNNITKNALTGNGGNGCVVIGKLVMSWGTLTETRAIPSEDNIISGNLISKNEGPIVLSNSGTTHTIISENTLRENHEGIRIETDASNNTIYHNNFIDNEENVHTEGTALNIWDSGYPFGGNYWSDYNGTDSYTGPNQNETGSDGIGDTPYIIDSNNQDNYPLAATYPPPPQLDINRDGTTDLKDIGIAARAFGSYPDHSRWNYFADVNSDGKVDMKDISLVARDFGNHH